MKRKIFNIIQIGDKSNHLSRAFDIFITATIILNIILTFLQTFEELSFLSLCFNILEYVTLGIFCIEYILRIWTADYLYPQLSKCRARIRFIFSFDGIVDILTIIPVFFLSGFVIFRMLRVARIFHLFRLNAKYDSFNVITTVLYEKRNQIISSVFIVLVLMLASSLCMYSVGTRCPAGGLPQCLQRCLVEYVHTADRRVWGYLSDHTTRTNHGDRNRLSGSRCSSHPNRYHQCRFCGTISAKQQYLQPKEYRHQGYCGDLCRQAVCRNEHRGYGRCRTDHHLSGIT